MAKESDKEVPGNKINDNEDIKKESEVQPPNPVPPESQSKEKIDPPVEIKETANLKESLPKMKEINKEFDTHPRNLNTKVNESKIVNGISNGEKSTKEKSEEKKDKPSSDQDKIDIIKQQKLMETIKQHHIEQKELMKEQKEILHELKKTKEELQLNKQDKEEKIDSNEAKKIAVESIQKIANMAIQSLGGVSDKPVNKVYEISNGKSKENLEKIANDAVQEIAKKAVETIAAIKESEDKQLRKDHNLDSNNKLNDGIINNQGNVQQQINNMPSNVQNNEPPKQIPSVNANLQTGQLTNLVNENVQNNAVIKPNPHLPEEPKSNKQGEDLQNFNQYKKSEIKTNTLNGVDQNVPLPLAIKPNLQMNQNIQPQQVIDNSNKNVPINIMPENIIVQNNQQNVVNSNNNQMNNGIQNNKYVLPLNVLKDNLLKSGNVPNQENALNSRQKREVVDCTEKTILKPEDKQICETLVINYNSIEQQKVSEDNLLPSIDLGKDISRKSPLDNVVLHIRSLKSIDEDKNR